MEQNFLEGTSQPVERSLASVVLLHDYLAICGPTSLEQIKLTSLI
jgi:hypothetical protein